MNKNIKTILILIFFLSLLPFKVFAIAQAVDPIIIKNAIRGGEYEKTLFVFNTSDKEMEINISAVGEIEKWATFFDFENLENPIKSIIVPPKSNKPAIVKFLIPQDAPNKIYLGKIIVSTSPKKSEKEGASASLVQEVPREISIEITDKEIICCETKILPQNFSLKKNEPLEIKIIYYNKGNVRIKPSIQQKIVKDGKTIFNAIFPYTEDKEGIKPLTRETTDILYQTIGLENGKYETNITVSLNNKEIQEDNFVFTIGNVKETKKFQFNKDYNKYLKQILTNRNFIGFVIVLIFIILMAFRIRKLNRKLQDSQKKDLEKKEKNKESKKKNNEDKQNPPAGGKTEKTNNLTK